MKRILFAVTLLLTMSSPAAAEIKKEQVTYKSDGVSMVGHIYYDGAVSGPRPGVIVVHEWWGLNEYAHSRAKKLAKLGYTAFAIDMYGDGKVAVHPDSAKEFSSKVRADMPGAKERFQSAYRILKVHRTVDPEKIAAIGYCFGGGMVLQMAREGLPLSAVVSFHGSLTPLAKDSIAKRGQVKAKILVCNGAADTFISKESIENFKSEMDDAGVEYQFKSYPDATHSFTNPAADSIAEKFGTPIAYNQAADTESWSDMQDFLKAVFAQ